MTRYHRVMKFPRWMSWLFVAFLAYILYLGNFGAREYTPPTLPEKAASGDAAPKSYPKLESLTSMATWKRAIDPTTPQLLEITDTKTGEGMPVGCGSTVTMTLRGTTPDGANFDETHDEKKPLTFTVGKAPYPVLNEAVLGMQVGGTRHVRSPAERLTPGKNVPIESVLLNITLTKSSDTAAAEHALPLTIVPMKEATEGTPAMCGEKALFRISKVAGDGVVKIIRVGAFTLGDSGFGSAIDRAAQGMGLGEERLVLAPNTQKSPALKDGAVLIERLKKD